MRKALFVACLSLAFAGPVASAHAFSGPHRAWTYRVTPKPKDGIARLRKFAADQQWFYKFPFAYRDAVLMTESETSESRTFCAWEEGDTLHVQIEVHAAGLLSSLGEYDPEPFRLRVFNGAFPAPIPQARGTQDTAPLCDDLRRIQWVHGI